ncbi:hypothetical protein ACFL0T_04935 [Candidatus Omnitrophota bacterium]
MKFSILKLTLIFTLGVFFFSYSAYAELLELKDGEKIDCDIIKETDHYIVVKSDYKTRIIMNEEIALRHEDNEIAPKEIALEDSSQMPVEVDDAPAVRVRITTPNDK